MTQRERDGDGERQAWSFLHHSLKFLIAGKHDSPDGVTVGLIGLPLAGLPLGPQARALLPIFCLKTDTACVSDFSSLPAARKEKRFPQAASGQLTAPVWIRERRNSKCTVFLQKLFGRNYWPFAGNKNTASKCPARIKPQGSAAETNTSIRRGGSGQPKQAAPADERQPCVSEDPNPAKESASKSAELPGSCLQLACICTSSAVFSSNRVPKGSGSSL